MGIFGFILLFAVLGFLVVSVANTDKSKSTESGVGGAIMGVIIFAGILLFIALPIMLLSNC